MPVEGPAIVAANHISYLDPFAHGYFLVQAGRRPRFLGKAELFDNLLTGWALRGAGQIPVRRGTGDRTPLREAEAALAGGEVVVIYPEGTVTRNEDFSPMRGKTGLVRLALATSAPIVPIAVWGSQQVWQKSGKGKVAFGRPVWLKAGPALYLTAEPDREDDIDRLRRLSDDVMGELSALVEDLRARYPRRWSEAR